MNVLVPKKGSKEQVKLEEGRIIYAMLAEQPINLANMIVDRLRAAMGRKSSPICYGMHLMEIMEKAGVDLRCIESDEIHFNSVIDHHTLQRIGYKKGHGGWDYVGKGKEQAQVPRAEEQEEEREEEEEAGEEETPQAPQDPQTSQPAQPTPSRPRTIPSTSNLATKTDFAHLQTYLTDHINLLQATLLSKLDSLESRVHTLESHILFQYCPLHTPPPSPPLETQVHISSPIPQSPQPSPEPEDLHMVFPYPLGSPYITFPPSTTPPPPCTSPISIASSSSSSSMDPDRYALVVRQPSTQPRSPSVDSEATTSDHHSPPPPTIKPPSPPQPQPSTTTYRRRRLLPPS